MTFSAISKNKLDKQWRKQPSGGRDRFNWGGFFFKKKTLLYLGGVFSEL